MKQITLFLALLLTAAIPAHAQYDVRAFGALGDGKTKDTAAFQKALDTCAVNGGGEVLVSPGDYLIGSIQIGTHTILRLDKNATIHGSTDLNDYPIIDVRWEGRWEQGYRSLIYASNVDHIAILGPGHIIGNMSDAARGSKMRVPLLLEPISCTDVRWEDFSLEYSGTWCTHPTYCRDVVIHSLTIRNSRDGIDVDSCDNVRIDNCDIDTGDDSISLKSGRGMDGARLAKPCENVLITNCSLGDRAFACIGIGSETSGGIRNVRVQHCNFTHAGSWAFYIKTRIGRAGTIENIAADDIDVSNTKSGFLRINMISSGNMSTANDNVDGDIGIPQGKNFTFSNIRLHDLPALAMISDVSSTKPIEGLSLKNITGTCRSGIKLAYINDAALTGIAVTGFTGPLLSTFNVNGTGLDGAVAFTPKPAPQRRPTTAP